MTSGDSEQPALLPPRVHPTALLDGDVQLSEGVVIGPYCVITGPVRIGPGTRVLSHTVIEGFTTVGRDCTLGPTAAVGTAPSARAYAGGQTHLVIGDRVQIREFTSVHRSMYVDGGQATRIGDGCLLMPTSHVGHDSHVGDHVVIANGSMLGGHVVLGDRVVVGGGVEIHQFCRIGRLAMIGGGETVRKDVLPFGIYRGGGHRAYNVIGARRSGFDAATLREIRRTFTELQRSRTYVQGAQKLRADGWDDRPAVARELVEFIESSQRGVHAHVDAADGETASE